MRKLRVLIAEDETIQRDLLVDMLEDIGGVEIAGVVTSGQELSTTATLMQDQIDGLILDVDLGGGKSGLDTYIRLHARGTKLPAILVTGACPDIQDVYDFGVSDLVSKPYTIERLKRGIDTLNLHVQQKQYEESGGILVPVVSEEIIQLYPSDILYMESDKVSKMTKLYLQDGKNLYSTIPIKVYESYLVTVPFARASRSALVNVNKIANFDTDTIHFINSDDVLLAREDRITEVENIWHIVKMKH